MVGEIKDRLEQIINQTAKDKELGMLALDIQPDHIHLFVSSPPKNSPALIVNWFKGISARMYNHRFKPKIKWPRAYYVGTAGTVTSDTIKKYIKEQTNAGMDIEAIIEREYKAPIECSKCGKEFPMKKMFHDWHTKKWYCIPCINEKKYEEKYQKHLEKRGGFDKPHS